MPLALARCSTLGILAALGLAGSALATPETFPGIQGPVHWRDGSVVRVYIPKDPRGRTRDQQIADGVKVWNEDPTLKAHNVSFVPVIGDPPADPGTSIVVRWVATRPEVDDGKGGKKSADAVTSTAVSTDDDGKNPGIDSASMDFYDDPTDTSTDATKKLAIHEAGHALGIKHSTAERSVMNETNASTTLSDSDKREIAATYAAAEGHSQITPNIQFEDGLWRYRYDVQWLDGTALALFQVGIGNATLSEFLVPDGWRLDDFSHAGDVTFTMTGTPHERFVSFILADEKSYLDPDLPQLSFGFVANQGPGLRQAYLNGGITTLAPVPEPASWLLWVTALALGGGVIRRAGNPPQRMTRCR